MAKGDESYTMQLTLNKIQDTLSKLEVKIDDLDNRIKAIEGLDLKYELDRLERYIDKKLDDPRYTDPYY